jgi:hypothetical protein
VSKHFRKAKQVSLHQECRGSIIKTKLQFQELKKYKINLKWAEMGNLLSKQQSNPELQGTTEPVLRFRQ